MIAEPSQTPDTLFEVLEKTENHIVDLMATASKLELLGEAISASFVLNSMIHEI